MVEVKIFLMFLIWPTGQGADAPSWYVEPALTTEECQNKAATKIEEAREEFGEKVRTEFYCLNKDNRIEK